MRLPIFAAALLFVLAPIPGAMAGHPGKSAVAFSITADVGYGNEVFVTGDHADLSSSGLQSPGVKLTWSAGNVWRGNVAIESGATVHYKFVKHAGDNAGYCTGTATDLSGTQTLTAPVAPGPPYSGKHVRYTSTWSRVFILYRNLSGSGVWAETPLAVAGPGRAAGEQVFEVHGLTPPGAEMEFVFHNDAGQYDNAPAPPQNTAQGAAPSVPVPYQTLAAPFNYRTKLDVFQVQDGQVYNYRPPSTVSAPRVESRFVNSTASTIPGRNIHICLPRGYDNNLWKRYPVVYFHDGQNVFFPGGPFGTWDADRIATYETSQGRMREAILVAVDNGNDYGSDRRREYLPPGDLLSGTNGTADKYSQFLQNNVMPTLDYNYRTMNQPGQASRPQDDIVAGSSLGGLVTAYIGRESSGVFGKIGIFSPAFWAAPNYVANPVLNAPKLPLRIYLDIGSTESSTSMTDSGVYWNDAVNVYNAFLGAGYAVNSELLFHPECNGVHNESSWSRRLPGFFQFMLSPWDDAQWLAAQLDTPPLRLLSATSGSASVSFLAPLDVPFILERSTNLSNWSAWGSTQTAASLWEEPVISGTFPGGNSQFWRVRIPGP